MDATIRSNGTLPMPLPISWSADDRNAALGSAMDCPLTEPICTKRIGTVSSPPFAAAMIVRRALSPQR
jgi:hypothetical protein